MKKFFLETSMPILFCLITLSIFLKSCKDEDTKPETVEKPGNRAPEITEIISSQVIVKVSDTCVLTCSANDKDGDSLVYIWNSQYGEFPFGNVGERIYWVAPEEENNCEIQVVVDDGEEEASDFITLNVKEKTIPEIIRIVASPAAISPLSTCELICVAEDIDGDILEITWDTEFGSFPDGNLGDSISWLAPDKSGYAKIYVQVNDGENIVTDSTIVHVINTNTINEEVYSFELAETGLLVEMVRIPAGNFLMGNPGTPDAGTDESPQYEVAINYDFWMAKFEVTQEQWEAVMGNWNFTFNGNIARPAENVSWFDVQEFIDLINLSEMGNLWRLPSESEWEYVAKNLGDGPGFWWGEDFTYTEIENYAWINSNSGGQTHEVGTTIGEEPNPLGIWDMEGNVWEWCQDWYQPNYSGAPTDGSAWEQEGTQRVIRGGSFYNDARACLPNLRSMYQPNSRVPAIGFRLVRKDS